MTPTPPTHLPDDVATIWQEVIDTYGDDSIAGPALDAYCSQVAVERAATRAIQSDGLIVEGPKGEPIPHPALELQRRAQDEIRKWGNQFQPRRRR
ncbi:hypothetical protein CWT12_12315 [Actinomyces sp. 432]|uniref:P27 family phage terminase small subunit n=1 Tax=Actinomyces sp. 432 TaxID=2057798 RepID=UPI0013740A0F|nr:P27 family phage terminase small subunit [Actinomyces sp. 432]QHO91936.1 hypothetical protein CWT12_12315 [Actinomyces sp. 432]